MRRILSFLFSRLKKPRFFSHSSCITCYRHLSTLGGPPLNQLQLVHCSAGHRSLDAAWGAMNSTVWRLVQLSVCLALVATRVPCWLLPLAAHQDPRDLPCGAATSSAATPPPWSLQATAFPWADPPQAPEGPLLSPTGPSVQQPYLPAHLQRRPRSSHFQTHWVCPPSSCLGCW